MWQGFKTSIMRENVLDLAIAVVIGVAFGSVVQSLIDDVAEPPVGLAFLADFSNLFWPLGMQGTIYGLLREQSTTPGPFASLAEAKAAGAVTPSNDVFLNAVIGFLVVAMAALFVVLVAKRLVGKPVPPAPNTKTDRSA